MSLCPFCISEDPQATQASLDIGRAASWEGSIMKKGREREDAGREGRQREEARRGADT